MIAVLSPDWGSSSESGWFTRQVAGALATAAAIHVVTPGNGPATVRPDGVFTVHRMASGLGDKAARRQDLLLDALAETGHDPAQPIPADVSAVLDADQAEPWFNAHEVLAAIAPDRVVIADSRNLGALGAVDRYDRSLPVTLVALAGGSTLHAWRPFTPVAERAESILTATDAERLHLVERHGRGDAIHHVGAPLAANPSALTEPNPWMGDTGYLLVITDSTAEDDDEQADLANLLRMRFSDGPIGVVYRDGFLAWNYGRQEITWAVERSSDLARLMAWARVTVDLRTPDLFGRDCLLSLLYGTPIVVDAQSPANQHARHGGGLWYQSANELTWCVESLMDPRNAAAFGAQGRAYAEDGFGSTDRFITRVLEACRIESVTHQDRARGQIAITI